MTSFQNPMGATMPEAKKQALVELLREHQVPLIEDDVYAELYFGQHAPKPAKAFDTEGLVMHCGSFAKSLAPGYRVGWVAAGRFAQKVERLKLMTSLCAVDARPGGDCRLPAARRLRPPPTAPCAMPWKTSKARCWRRSRGTFPAQTRVSQPAWRVLFVA
jgi:hypothetical protein